MIDAMMSHDSPSPPASSNDSALSSISSCQANSNNNNAKLGRQGARIPESTPSSSSLSSIMSSVDPLTTQSNNLPTTEFSQVRADPEVAKKNETAPRKKSNTYSNHRYLIVPYKPAPGQHISERQLEIIRSCDKNYINSRELELAARTMRSNNVGLISRSTRTVLTCFDDLDIHQFESNTEYLISFISNGINDHPTTVRRPVSIIWPDTYDKMCSQLSHLDAFLINTRFKDKPVDWMLNKGITKRPNCQICKTIMELRYENNTVMWQCQKTQACANYSMPIQRSSFFRSFENVGLDKLLFSVYYWSICTPGEELYKPFKIDPNLLDSIWEKLQNVCRITLEQSYPRLRLTNVIDSTTGMPRPIDLVSVKLNNLYIVCAKHPCSNLVRLGIYLPGVSTYSFSELTEPWFASGSHIRVAESKFLKLTRRRSDLRVELVPRIDMISKDGHFDRDSAFGYIVCQLSHVFKDFNSKSVSTKQVKLLLAEMQWRELYGTTPFDSFTNIINHIAQFGEIADLYSDPSVPTKDEESLDKQYSQSPYDTEHIWAEKYFYATIDPIDSAGKLICRYIEPPDLSSVPHADVRLICHKCKRLFECFEFAMHMKQHVEQDRKEREKRDVLNSDFVECKHCFKSYQRDELLVHCGLVRAHLQMIQYGCRICCVRFEGRAKYLQHMRRTHFEHEVPYRCPSCLFASSFQRDVYIHFEEEHRHSMIIICPLCLKSFTVLKPEEMNLARMSQLSRRFYEHVQSHYLIAKSFACSNCCLCFVDREGLRTHKQSHHNPLEIHDTTRVKKSPFIVTKDEEQYCVKAIQAELFIANKRPNRALDPTSPRFHGGKGPKVKRKVTNGRRGNRESSESEYTPSSDSSSSSDEEGDEAKPKEPQRAHEGEADKESSLGIPVAPNIQEVYERILGSDNDSTNSAECNDVSPSSSDNEGYMTASEDGVIHVRGLSPRSKNLLLGGAKTLRVPRKISLSKSESKGNSELSSERLLSMMSRMKRADGVIANRSVVLDPKGSPLRCCECNQYLTMDHYVAEIKCRKCKHATYCHRAAYKHQKEIHLTA